MRYSYGLWCVALLLGWGTLCPASLLAQCPDPIPPKVRYVSCGTSAVKVVFDDNQPVKYDSHWISWGDGNIEQLFSRLKAASHTYATAGPRKITVWGTVNPNLCKSQDVVLDYNPALPVQKPVITAFRMTGKSGGELAIENPANTEMLLFRQTGTGDWESTGRTISKDKAELSVFVDSLAATCFRLQSTDTCLAESHRSELICSGTLRLDGLEKANEISWRTLLSVPGAKVSIKKDNNPWREVTAQGESGTLTDEDLSCGREHCYQLLIANQNSRFTSLPVCRRTPIAVCGVAAPLYVPDAFSPNGDGINDRFEIKGEVAASFELTIFSSWGTVVFHSLDIAQSWDGKLDGTPLPPGYYAYRILVDAAGAKFSKEGSVLLLE